MEIRHFILVHGACHGAWCWYKVVALLQSMGHKVTALDLAASSGGPMHTIRCMVYFLLSGRDTKQANQLRSISEYAEPLMEFMAAVSAEERVILVGHSMGGLPTTMAMERFPQKIAAAVFVAAIMPGPDLPFLYIIQQQAPARDFSMDCENEYDNGPEKPPTSTLFGPEYAASMLYQRSPPEDLILAFLLMRPSPLFSDPESLKGLSLTKENYGSVGRVYIVCNEDVGMEDMQEWLIEKNPPEDVQVLDGADHMAMFSKTSELCSCLIQVADKYL